MARWAPNEAARAGLANSFAGAVASMVTQSVVVPIDVVSQRLMVAGMVQQLQSHGLCPATGRVQEIRSTPYLQCTPVSLQLKVLSAVPAAMAGCARHSFKAEGHKQACIILQGAL